MLQLRLDQLTNSFFTWGGTAFTKTAQRWPGKFPVAIKASVGTTVGQLGTGATGSLILNAADGTLLAKVPSFTLVGSGATAVYNFFLDLDSAPIAARFNATGEDRIETLAAKMEIRFADADGSNVAYGSLDFTIDRAQGTGAETPPLPATASAQSGFIALPSGEDVGSIVFPTEMLSAPVVTLALVCPAGSPVITADLVGAPTVLGFDYELSDAHGNGYYYLAWSAAIVAGMATRQTAIATLASGTDTFDIAFSEAMTAPPIMRGLTVENAAGEPALIAYLIGAPTVDGFTVLLSADTTTANYRLHYDAEVPA